MHCQRILIKKTILSSHLVSKTNQIKQLTTIMPISQWKSQWREEIELAAILFILLMNLAQPVSHRCIRVTLPRMTIPLLHKYSNNTCRITVRRAAIARCVNQTSTKSSRHQPCQRRHRFREVVSKWYKLLRHTASSCLQNQTRLRHQSPGSRTPSTQFNILTPQLTARQKRSKNQCSKKLPIETRGAPHKAISRNF